MIRVIVSGYMIPLNRYFSGSFMLSMQVRFPSQGQEPVPIAVMDKIIFPAAELCDQPIPLNMLN